MLSTGTRRIGFIALALPPNIKENCMLLRDPDMRGLFLVNWDKFENHIQFPLPASDQSKEPPSQTEITCKTIPTPSGNMRSLMEDTQRLAISSGIEVVEPAGRPYAIRVIAGKGKGVIATMKINKGTRIMSEVPIFTVPRNNPDIDDVERIVIKEVEALDTDRQRAFLDLTNVHGHAHSQSLGIARTNVLPLGSNDPSGGLFLEASRINHSCRHNAQNTWNKTIGRLTIHALRDIEEGQEITISYLASTSEYTERQRFLKEKFKFDCHCQLCSLPPVRRKESDDRLNKLQAIDGLIGNFFWDGDLETALHLLHTMFDLFKEEGIWDASIARAYNDAYELAMEYGDEPRGRVFAERAYDARSVIEGSDGPATVKLSQAVEGIAAQAPQGMSDTQFDSWLWMRSGLSGS
jgi:hypothetical protein